MSFRVPIVAALLLVVAAAGSGTSRARGPRDAFILLGPTSDNALREAGVWSGLFEAFSGGVFDQAGGAGIIAAMNSPHTTDELKQKVISTLDPLHKKLQQNEGWRCLASGGDCTPETFFGLVVVNIQEGRDACAQAEDIKKELTGFDRVSVYLSVPPFVFGEWATCAVQHWSDGDTSRVHVAAEKPFGTSLEDAQQLHQAIVGGGLLEENLHLVDHWLSFFMVKNLPVFRKAVQPLLGVSWDRTNIERIVVTEYEERGLEGRGSFFDGVGQVRDMVQSHLLQVLLLTLVDPDAAAKDRDQAKFDLLNRTTIGHCRLGQYDGFLMEPKLEYHAAVADATFCDVLLAVDSKSWWSVPMVIVTGKDMGVLQYTVELFQRNGPGVLTFEIGKEETGRAGIAVKNWPLKQSGEFKVPAGGFDTSRTVTLRPNVNSDGNGYIASFDDPNMYFPSPYAMLTAALLTRDYSSAFVTFEQCRTSWKIVTSWSSTLCLDTPGEVVQVYGPPGTGPCGGDRRMGGTPEENLCWQSATVQDLYDDKFKCSPEHDRLYTNVSLYQAKCHPSIQMPRIVQELLV